MMKCQSLRISEFSQSLIGWLDGQWEFSIHLSIGECMKLLYRCLYSLLYGSNVVGGILLFMVFKVIPMFDWSEPLTNKKQDNFWKHTLVWVMYNISIIAKLVHEVSIFLSKVISKCLEMTLLSLASYWLANQRPSISETFPDKD